MATVVKVWGVLVEGFFDFICPMASTGVVSGASGGLAGGLLRRKRVFAALRERQEEVGDINERGEPNYA
jgi:hypothetical protein